MIQVLSHQRNQLASQVLVQPQVQAASLRLCPQFSPVVSPLTDPVASRLVCQAANHHVFPPNVHPDSHRWHQHHSRAVSHLKHLAASQRFCPAVFLLASLRVYQVEGLQASRLLSQAAVRPATRVINHRLHQAYSQAAVPVINHPAGQAENLQHNRLCNQQNIRRPYQQCNRVAHPVTNHRACQLTGRLDTPLSHRYPHQVVLYL